jgi:hypothetical protein
MSMRARIAALAGHSSASAAAISLLALIDDSHPNTNDPKTHET